MKGKSSGTCRRLCSLSGYISQKVWAGGGSLFFWRQDLQRAWELESQLGRRFRSVFPEPPKRCYMCWVKMNQTPNTGLSYFEGTLFWFQRNGTTRGSLIVRHTHMDRNLKIYGVCVQVRVKSNAQDPNFSEAKNSQCGTNP